MFRPPSSPPTPEKSFAAKKLKVCPRLFFHPGLHPFSSRIFSEKKREKITENIRRDKRQHGIPQNWSEYDLDLTLCILFLTVFNFIHVINFCSAAVRHICISYFKSETGIKGGTLTRAACDCIYRLLLAYLFICPFVIHSNLISPGQ